LSIALREPVFLLAIGVATRQMLLCEMTWTYASLHISQLA